jgi:hypothetical protein
MFFDEKLDGGMVQHPKVGDEYSDDLIQYHLGLRYEAGLLIADIRLT